MNSTDIPYFGSYPEAYNLRQNMAKVISNIQSIRHYSGLPPEGAQDMIDALQYCIDAVKETMTPPPDVPPPDDIGASSSQRPLITSVPADGSDINPEKVDDSSDDKPTMATPDAFQVLENETKEFEEKQKKNRKKSGDVESDTPQNDAEK